MSLAILKAKADTAIANSIAKAQTFQDNHRRQRGIYWQGLVIPAIVPVDEIEQPVDPTRKPHYQATSWAARAFSLPATAAFTLQVDCFDGPLGKAWTATVMAIVNAKLWSKTAFGGGDFTPPINDWISTPTI